MSAAYIALIVAAVTAISTIFLKRGLEASNPLTGMFVSLAVCGAVITALALATVPAAEVTLGGVAIFAGIGLFAPPVVRYLTYVGIDKVGAARSSPIRSLTPFFAILLAITFLGEEARPNVLGGAVLIVGGAFLLSKKPNKKNLQKSWSKWDLLYPFSAAILAGCAANLRKAGFAFLDSPVLAAASTAIAALIVFSTYVISSGRRGELDFNPASIGWFLVASACTSVSIVLNLVALKLGDVSVVSPILASSPLFVIFFSAIFLRKIERVTTTLVAGALLTFAGVESIIFL